MKEIEIITGGTKYPAPFTHRVLILCKEKIIPYLLTTVDTEKKPDWFIDISPLGLIPVLRINERIVFDSHAICEYLDTFSKPSIFPDDPFVCAQHKSWMMFADEVANEIAQLVKQGNIVRADFRRLQGLLDLLNKKIKGDYFFGDQFSFVDIYLISHLLWIDSLEEKNIILPVIKNYANVNNWLIKIKQRPCVKETMGENYVQHFIALLKQYHLIP